MHDRLGGSRRWSGVFLALSPVLWAVACVGGSGGGSVDALPFGAGAGEDAAVTGDLGAADEGDGADVGPAADLVARPDVAADVTTGLRIPSFPKGFLAQEIAWEPCPLFGGEPGGECAEVSVPWRWAEPEGPTLVLRVMRYQPEPGRAPRSGCSRGGRRPAFR